MPEPGWLKRQNAEVEERVRRYEEFRAQLWRDGLFPPVPGEMIQMRPNQTLGERLRQARNQRGFTQERLANDAGISVRTVKAIEADETTTYGDTLFKFCLALDVSADWLLGVDEARKVRTSAP